MEAVNDIPFYHEFQHYYPEILKLDNLKPGLYEYKGLRRIKANFDETLVIKLIVQNEEKEYYLPDDYNRLTDDIIHILCEGCFDFVYYGKVKLFENSNFIMYYDCKFIKSCGRSGILHLKDLIPGKYKVIGLRRSGKICIVKLIVSDEIKEYYLPIPNYRFTDEQIQLLCNGSFVFILYGPLSPMPYDFTFDYIF